MKILIILILIFFHCLQLEANTSNDSSITLRITLKNVYSCNISVSPFYMGVSQKLIAEARDVKDGQTIALELPIEYLPGEFVVRYDYAVASTQGTYPSEQLLIVNDQDLIWTVDPIFCNNSDKTWFQKGEIENTLLLNFNKDMQKQREKLQLLQQFMLGYKKDKTRLYRLAHREYLKLCTDINKKIYAYEENNEHTFAKTFFRLNAVPIQDFKENSNENIEQLLVHYFDHVNFNDSLIWRLSSFTKKLNDYINLSAQSRELSDQKSIELFYADVAKDLIEKAKKGHPLVYGFVVDYFYIGFERNNFSTSMEALYPYVTDPTCKTTQRLALEKRLAGSKTLIVGNKVPDFLLDSDLSLHTYSTDSNYKLLLFWSADCYHCEEELKLLEPVFEKHKDSKKLSVLTVSLDETDYEIEKWVNKTTALKEWKHIRPIGGIESEPCKKYFITSTPTMFLIDAKTNVLIYTPRNTEDLDSFLSK